jgi:Glycosyl transferase family 8
MPKVGLVFSTDETFAPLAKGLVLSLRAHRNAIPDIALNLIDIGCSESTREWMSSQGVHIKPFAPSEYMGRRRLSNLKSYQSAQLCRPFLPKIFPEYDAYLWCDSDIWVQEPASLLLIAELAAREPHKLIISPLIDISYSYFYNDSGEFIGYNHSWFRDAYGDTVAATYSKRAILSSGIFGLSAKSELWSLWDHEISAVLKRDIPTHFSLHVAEQTALNYLAYSTANFIPISATHNYNCHIGVAKRVADGVVVDIAPFPRIGIVHLTYTSKMIAQYIDDGLLFDEGKYLTIAEIERLKRISHY